MHQNNLAYTKIIQLQLNHNCKKIIAIYTQTTQTQVKSTKARFRLCQHDQKVRVRLIKLKYLIYYNIHHNTMVKVKVTTPQ